MIQDFYKATVMYGVPPEVPGAAGLVSKLHMPLRTALRNTPRLVNHFMLGADPEFVFAHGGKRRDASAFRLKTGLFVGADQNGRLVEVRPKADRSALRVVASILSSLRWLAALKPDTLAYNWEAGAWKYDDGIGGHIHFGRKTPNRALEIIALNGLAHVLYSLGVFPADEQARRMQGDAHRQRYGLPSDYRLQVHGYEYRSLPSWLDSPWLAYLCIVLGKLAVHQPELVAPWEAHMQPTVDNLRNLLGYYKGLDDDAALALYALDILGLPQHIGGDFKGRWGIHALQVTTRKDINVWPTSVAPSADDVQDLFNYFTLGSPPEYRQPKASWAPTTVPDDFVLCTDNQDTRGQVGVGELLWDMVCHVHHPVTIVGSDHKNLMWISPDLVAKMPPDWKQRIHAIAPGIQVSRANEGNRKIGISKDLRQAKKIQLTKAVLTSGLFPLWRVSEATEEKFRAWRQVPQAPKVVATVNRGVQVYPPVGKQER